MRRTTLLALMAGVMVAATWLSPVVSVAAGEGGRKLVVVVNKENRVSNIDLTDLRDLYFGKRRFWADGARVRVADLVEKKVDEEKNAFTLFARQYLSKEPEAVKSYWIRMIFAGRGQPPQQLDSPEKVIKYVASDEGCVGYLYDDQVTDEVKVVAISRPEE